MQVQRPGWILLCVVLAVAGCSEEPELGERPALSESHEQIVAASNELAMKLYGGLRDKPGNLVLSPYGVSMSLSMLLAGADGPTRDELLALLGAEAKQEQQLHAAQGELLRWLAPAEDAASDRIDIAAGLFVQTDQDVLLAFQKLLDTNYHALPYVVDFVTQPATARKVVNDWAAEKTHDKIRDVVSPDEITNQTRAILASAVYFKGSWRHAFKRSQTEQTPFHLSAEKSVDVAMMYQNDEFGYQHEDGVRVLVMPYQGDLLSMVLVLPDERDGLAAVEVRLDSETLRRWTTSAKLESLPVWLPRFQFENTHDLQAVLETLGLETTFDPAAADLSRIDGIRPTAGNAGDRLFVDRIRQRALIDVNEEGTEAAAVTTTTLAKSEKVVVPDPPEFRADHPFLFFIRENETGLILFMGRVMDPTATG